MPLKQESQKLFAPISIGEMKLRNRMVMAPMTRGRADNAGLVPNELMVEYYRQRAAAGLIITEGAWPNAEGIGFPNVPGIFTQEQADGWRSVVNAVHKEGGRIFSQLGHAGPYAHPDFLKGALPVSPSGINPNDKVFGANGFTDSVTPRVMSIADIERTIEDFRKAASFAKNAGFDGVEIHGAHTFLIPSFLNSNFNRREDRYGGSPENRSRLLLEIVSALVEVWGANRVGVKLSPFSKQGGFVPAPDTEETYRYLVKALDGRPLAYLHLLGDSTAKDLTGLGAMSAPWKTFRKDYRGLLIAGGGFSRESGEELLERGEADLIAYGLPFIANPDLVERFRTGAALAAAERAYFYSPGAKGYIDYPPASTAPERG